jgi:hypothetical protein
MPHQARWPRRYGIQRRSGWGGGMMGDIVERLRDPEQGLTSSDRFHLHKDAADEIERLRAAILDYISEYENPVPDAIYRRILRTRLYELAKP